MRGTRYGDFSRLRRWSGGDGRGLLLQQGRVQLDADANHQSELGQQRLEEALTDLRGPGWGPADGAGFEIVPVVELVFDGASALAWSVADLILDSEPLTIEVWLTWDGQAAILLEGLTDGKHPHTLWSLVVDHEGSLTLRIASGRRGDWSLSARGALPLSARVQLAIVFGRDKVILFSTGRQLAQTVVEHTETEKLAELVVGGPSQRHGLGGLEGTLAGLRVWQVVRSPDELAATLGPATSGTDQPLAFWWFAQGSADPLIDRVNGYRLSPVAGRPPQPSVSDLLLGSGRYYVGGVACRPAAETLRGQPGSEHVRLPRRGRYLAYVEVWEDTSTALDDPALIEPALHGRDTVVLTRSRSCVRLAELTTDVGRTLGELVGAPAGRLTAAHSGAELPGNFLYRVEVCQPGVVGGSDGPDDTGDGIPTFVWSRRNGADVFAIEPLLTPRSVVAVLPRVGLRPLAPGDLVQPLVPGSWAGDPIPDLRTVLDVGDDGVALDADVPAGTAGLRRWDGGPLEPAEWCPLESGIEVRFGPGRYRGGDYWWIVARQDLQTIEWPQERGHPLALPPDGVERRLAPLAVLTIQDESVEVEDLRVLGGGPIDGVVSPSDPSSDSSGARSGMWSGTASGTPASGREFVDVLVADEDDVDLVSASRSGPLPIAPPVNGPSADLGWTWSDAGDAAADDDHDDGDTTGTGGDDDEVGVTSPSPARWDSGSSSALSVRAPVAVPKAGRSWSLLVDLGTVASRLSSLLFDGRHVVLGTERALLRVDTESGAVTELASLGGGWFGYRLAELADDLIVLGGSDATGRTDGRVVALSSTGSTRQLARLPRTHHNGGSFALTDGVLHAIGGGASGRIIRGSGRTHHTYDPEQDQWIRSTPTLGRRTGAHAATLSGTVHVLGGDRVSGRTADRHERLPSGGSRWTDEPPVPGGRQVLALAPHRNELTALVDDPEGRRQQGMVAFDPTTAVWRRCTPLPVRLEQPHLTSDTAGGRLLVSGFDDQGHLLVLTGDPGM